MQASVAELAGRRARSVFAAGRAAAGQQTGQGRDQAGTGNSAERIAINPMIDHGRFKHAMRDVAGWPKARRRIGRVRTRVFWFGRTERPGHLVLSSPLPSKREIESPIADFRVGVSEEGPAEKPLVIPADEVSVALMRFFRFAFSDQFLERHFG